MIKTLGKNIGEDASSSLYRGSLGEILKIIVFRETGGARFFCQLPLYVIFFGNRGAAGDALTSTHSLSNPPPPPAKTHLPFTAVVPCLSHHAGTPLLLAPCHHGVSCLLGASQTRLIGRCGGHRTWALRRGARLRAAVAISHHIPFLVIGSCGGCRTWALHRGRAHASSGGHF